jgi:hypothetical protein
MTGKQYGIYVLVALYVLLGGVYSVVTPVMEASDELWHYPMVKYIADHWALPVQDPEQVGPWRQEGSQAPLYYALGAALTAWIDTSDMEQVRRLNPYADNGIPRSDGNTNLIIHSPAEGFPWRGTVLAIHIVRFASVLMGVGTVYLTYLLVLELWPTRHGLALGAAALTAFNAMFCFISGAVNNDNLAMLLCAAAIWLLVRLVRRHGAVESLSRSSWWIDTAVLGVVLGAAVLTKSQSLGLLPLTALAVGYVAWRRRSWWHLVTGGTVTAGLVALLSGWWFVRNAILYDGDWMGIERFITILGYRVPPATLRQLWGERHGFMMAFWGFFGGVNVPMPDWIYTVLNVVLLLAGIGLLIGLGNRVARSIKHGLRFRHPKDFQLLLLFLWPAVVVLLWALWATKTWSSQGRLVFSAMSAWSTWIALGLVTLFSWRPQLQRWSYAPLAGLAVFMLAVATWAPFGVIAPAYRAPVLSPDTEPTPTHVLRADVGGQLRLLGYDVEEASLRPGEAVRFTLYWEALREMDRDWSVFAHVLDRHIESPVAIRDRYPGQGLLATSTIEPGTRWVDRYVVELPETVYAPSDVVLEVGLYDASNQERLPIRIEQGEGVEIVDNALHFQPLAIRPRPGQVSNPVHINFADRLALVGWDVGERRVATGEDLSLTLYWECLATMDESFTVSAQVLGQGGQKAAQSDVWPASLDTASCQPGQQIVDRRQMRVDDSVTPGIHDLLISVYSIDSSQQLERLRIINSEGRVLPEDSWILGQVRVVP